jgi:hypothetical protein
MPGGVNAPRSIPHLDPEIDKARVCALLAPATAQRF